MGRILMEVAATLPEFSEWTNPTLEQSLALTMSLRSELGGQFTEKSHIHSNEKVFFPQA